MRTASIRRKAGTRPVFTARTANHTMACMYCGETAGAHGACAAELLRRSAVGICTFCGDRPGVEGGAVCSRCRGGGAPYAYRGYGRWGVARPNR